MLNILAKELRKIIENIDTGNCDLTEEELQEVITNLKRLSDREEYVSKYEAYTKYLRVSKATFENYIARGWIPEGIKRVGFKEKAWKVKDLYDFIKRKENKNDNSTKVSNSNFRVQIAYDNLR